MSAMKRTSEPSGAMRMTEKRSASAPYIAMMSSGSGELPRLFDILRPCLSRMMLVKNTLPKGFSSLNSKPAMIMRATQKKMMSGPVTRSVVG